MKRNRNLKVFSKLGLVLALATAVFLGMVGIAVGQMTQTVTGSYVSDYTPASCILNVVLAGPTSITGAVPLSTSGTTLYVENTGAADSNGNPASMSVSVAYQDNADPAAVGSAGWYNAAAPGSTWIPAANLSTRWSSTEQVGPYPLTGVTGFSQGPAYADLPSGPTATYQPITFTVVPIANLPSYGGSAYNQQIVFTGGGC